MVNEGLGWDPLLKMFHNPGGHDCILGGGHTQEIGQLILPPSLSDTGLFPSSSDQAFSTEADSSPSLIFPLVIFAGRARGKKTTWEQW